jgi:hypothetical protein
MKYCFALFLMESNVCSVNMKYVLLCFRWRTASVSTSSDPIDKDGKLKYFISGSEYNALGKRSTVEYSHSNQGFDQMLNYDPYITVSIN